MKKSIPHFSIIAPIYNEEKNLPEFYRRLSVVMKGLKKHYEIIFINDGSRDESLTLLTKMAKKDKLVKVIDLSRNFGKEAALTCGIDYSSGHAVIPIDSDLQDPPELITQLALKWEEGFDVVYAKRTKRKGETILKKFTANMFYKVFQKLVSFNIPLNTGDFRLMDRKVVNSLSTLRERNRFMKGLFSWVGFRQTGVEYIRDSRYLGTTSWSYFKLFGFAMDGITSFSIAPLKLATFFGFITSLCAIIYAFFIFLDALIYGNPVEGYPSLLVIILFMGGIQLLSIGIIGEYIGRVFDETKQRPLYLIQKKIGL